MMFLQLIIMATLWTLGGATEFTLGSHKTRNHCLDGYKFTMSMLWESQAPSAGICAAMCARQESCVTFTFDGSTCRGHSIPVTSVRPSATPFAGARTFVKSEAGLLRLPCSASRVGGRLDPEEHYIASNIGKTVVSQDLWDSFDEAAMSDDVVNNNEDFAKFDSWLTQSGFPVVTAVRGISDVALSQEPYHKSDSTSAWHIPITVISSADPKREVTYRDYPMLSSTTGILVIDLDNPTPSMDDNYTAPAKRDTTGTHDWVLVNVNSAGYYVVDYDVSNWKALTNQLNTDHTVFPVLNRGQIIHDAYFLHVRGDVSLSTLLGTLDFLENEDASYPWFVARDRILRRIGHLHHNTYLASQMKTKMTQLVHAQLEEKGMTVQFQDTPTDIQHRVYLADLACTVGEYLCTQSSISQVQLWQKTGRNGIQPDLRKLMYCATVRYGPANLAQFILDAALAEEDPKERARLQYGLTCADDPSRMIYIINSAWVHPSAEADEITALFVGIASHGQLNDYVFFHIANNFNGLSIALGASRMSTILLSAVEFSKRDYHKQLLEYMEKQTDDASLAYTITFCLQTIDTNKEAWDRESPIFTKWFAGTLKDESK